MKRPRNEVSAGPDNEIKRKKRKEKKRKRRKRKRKKRRPRYIARVVLARSRVMRSVGADANIMRHSGNLEVS